MNALEFSLMLLFHPVDVFALIKKERSKFDYRPVIVLLLLVVLVRIAYIFTVHYPLATLEPRDTNIGLEIVKMWLPILTWTISCYAVTAIIDGESMLREILMASAYCMLPYIIMMLPLAALSHIMSANNSALYNVLHSIVWIWVVLLYITSVKVLNDYSLKKTLGICVLSIIGMLLIWAILLLLFALTSQLFHFFQGIMLEFRMLLYRN